MSLINDAVFFVSIATIVAAMYKFSVTYCLKSKCTEFNLCCLKIRRDVKAEVEIEIAELENKKEEEVKPEEVEHL
jgi:hypothetical protein